MALTFNHSTQRIVVLSPQTSLTIQDLVDACRVEEESARGITNSRIISASGKEILGSGVQVGITCTLLDNWQLEWWAGNYTATISGGNIVAESGDPVAYVVGGPQVEITLSAAATITSGSGGPSAEDIASAVWQRVIEGSLTAENIQRLMLAFAANNATVPAGAGSFAFRDRANGKDRVVGTVDSSGNRVITSVDGT